MPEFKSPGELAYLGFYQKSGGKSVITSEPLPAWGAHTQALKDSWEAAAVAVNTPQTVEPPKPAEVPKPQPVYVPAKPEAPKAVTQTMPSKLEPPQKWPASQPALKPKTP